MITLPTSYAAWRYCITVTCAIAPTAGRATLDQLIATRLGCESSTPRGSVAN